MGIRVEDLTRQIRTEANSQGRSAANGENPTGDCHAGLDRLRAALAVARRAQDRLPPVTTYRHGVSARVELWIKRRLKTATRWFTWEQANFNAATVTSLESTLRSLTQLESALLELRVNDNSDSAEPESLIAAVEIPLAAMETSLQSLIEQIRNEQNEQARRLDLLLDEQRVCFKQLAMQISEAAVVSDRAKRNLQTQLDELRRRLDKPQGRAAIEGR